MDASDPPPPPQKKQRTDTGPAPGITGDSAKAAPQAAPPPVPAPEPPAAAPPAPAAPPADLTCAIAAMNGQLDALKWHVVIMQRNFLAMGWIFIPAYCFAIPR